MLVAQHLPHATIDSAVCKQHTVSVMIVGISALCGRRFSMHTYKSCTHNGMARHVSNQLFSIARQALVTVLLPGTD